MINFKLIRSQLSIDAIYKYITFGDFFIRISEKLLIKRINKCKKAQQQLINELKNKEEIKVVFFFQTPATWRYDTIYRAMEKEKRFSPLVVLSPFNVHLKYKKSELFKTLEQSESFVKKQGYNYLNAYDKNHNKWINIRKTINPDIVFFTKPYKDTLPNYHIYKFQDKLTCYNAYSITGVDNFYMIYNLAFHNLLWKFFIETTFQQNDAIQHSVRKGENTEVIGSLADEVFIDKQYIPKDVWKPQNKPKKRIVWAPHHTIDYFLFFSTFLEYYDLMFDLAEKYADDIQIAFKPHPVLKYRLINIWGKERTEAYYKKWDSLENTQLADGYYTDLFLTSDALIHDSVSFAVEYLFTKKPLIFCVRDEKVVEHWNKNELGKRAFELHYKANKREDIENFIQAVVLQGNDPMFNSREDFYTEYLYPKDGKLPSQKILDILKRELKIAE